MRSVLVENNLATITSTYDQAGRVISIQSEETSTNFEYGSYSEITEGPRLFDAHQAHILVSSDSDYSPSR